MVIAPKHDYYPLTPHAQEQVPRFLRRYITPREPPDEHVVCIHMIYFHIKSAFTTELLFTKFLIYISSYPQVLTVGALHQVDSASLRSAANAWHDEFAPLPKPLLVVNIGGPTSNHSFSILVLDSCHFPLLLFCLCSVSVLYSSLAYVLCSSLN